MEQIQHFFLHPFFIPFFLYDVVYEELAQPEIRSLHELVGTLNVQVVVY
jgi:hypothetical protein